MADDCNINLWYDAPKSFHADQIKLLPLYFKLGARAHLSVGLAAGGYLIQRMAERVSQLICDDAEHILTPSLQDYTNSYLSLLRNKTTPTTHTTLGLPFPSSNAWTQSGELAHSWTDILVGRDRLGEWVKSRRSGRPTDL